ncbi:hypothetical protein GQ457_06G036990 [Hibiscus cannabinus]
MSSRRSRSRQSGNNSRISDDQINDLVSKLHQLLPEIRNAHSDKVSAAKVLQETCNYIRSLHREVDDLSERLSELLATTDNAQAAIIPTWVKQNDRFRKRENVQHNQQIQDIKQDVKTNGEGSRTEKNELTVWHDSPKSDELTRHSDLTKGCHVIKALQNSDINLGASKDPTYQGILAEWSPMNRTVYQINSNAMVLSDGQSQWNKPLALPNQFAFDPAVNKGKSILEYREEKVNDKMEDLVSDFLQDMDISSCMKRKMDNSEGWDFSAAKKKQELMKQIFEGIHEISPGNWGDDGFGPVANENYLKLALFPESVANVSSIINKFEKKKKGFSFGSRRLTLIKRAARRKHVLEITRMTLENHLIVERGIDPYGLNLNCNPTLVVANDPMMSEEPNCLAFEETVCSSYADDSMESHLQSL